MMKKMLVYLITIFFLLLTFSTNAFATINKITITDDVDDVIKMTDEEEEITNVSRPNIDIYRVICEQDGRNIRLTLQLRESGTITVSNTTIYSFTMITTHNNYDISFGGLIKELGEYEGLLSIEATNHFTSDTTDLTDGNYEGANTNILTITFTLLHTDERIISCSAMTMDMSILSSTGYMDILEDNNIISPVSGGDEGVYKAQVGETVNFNGSLEEGLNPEDYEWVWVIVNENYRTEAVLENQNPQHYFAIPGNYTGLLFVYNETGIYGITDFEVDISGKVSGGGSQEEKGTSSNLITFILILVIIIVAGVAVVIFFLRRR